MKFYTDAELAVILDKKHIFRQISQVIDSLGVDGYVVGGYVRDIFLERPSNDIDVVIGSVYRSCSIDRRWSCQFRDRRE